MTKAVAFGIVALGLIAAGCAPKPSLVGKWTGDMTLDGRIIPGEFEFTSDGKLRMMMGQGGIGIVITSTYSLDGEKLKTTLDTFEMEGEVPPTVKPMVDQALKQLESMKGKTDIWTVVFNDADTIEATFSGGQKGTWTRVKAE